MSRTDRILASALLASAALHVAVLVATPRMAIRAIEPESPQPLAARLVAPAPVSVESPKTPPPRSAAPQSRTPRAAAAATRLPPRSLATTDRAAIIPDPPPPDGGYAAELAAAAAAASGPAPSAEPRGAEASADAGEGEYPVRHARLVYDLSFGGGPAGVVTHTWSYDGRAYRAESIAQGTGLVKLFFDGRFVQRSVGTVGRDGLIPAEYTLERGSAARREQARFDWDAGRVVFTFKEERREDGLPDGTQDALSILHQAYFERPAGGAAPVGIATGRKLGHYVYELLGERLIETPIGILRTLHVRRLDQDGKTLDAWLDLDRSLLPVRIVAAGPLGSPLEQVIREARIETAAGRDDKTAAAGDQPFAR